MDWLALIAILMLVFGMAGKWCNEGETQVGESYLKGDAPPQLYVGLYKDATEPAEDATLATITEVPAENGYARIILVKADWTEDDVKGVFENIQKVFAASGGAWGQVYGYFLTDCLTGTAGKLVSVEDFSNGPYTVNDGWSVKVTPKVTIQ